MVFSKKNPNLNNTACKLLITLNNNKIPIKNKNSPLIFLIISACFFKKYNRGLTKLKNIAVIINGIASPNEKNNNNTIPLIIESPVDTNANIEPSNGPTHGVHPAAKAIPTNKVPKFPVGNLVKLNLFS